MQEWEQLLHRQADHFCPFGVMLEKDGVNRPKGKKTALVDSYNMLFDFGLLISLYLCISVYIAQRFSILPSCYLPVTVVNPFILAPHPHLSLHITIMLCHSGSIPADSSSHDDPRLLHSGVHDFVQLHSQECLSFSMRLLTVLVQSLN